MDYKVIKQTIDDIIETHVNCLLDGSDVSKTAKAIIDLQKALGQSIELDKLLGSSTDIRSTEALLGILGEDCD
jgi:hypothetical protein